MVTNNIPRSEDAPRDSLVEYSGLEPLTNYPSFMRVSCYVTYC